MFPEKSSAAGFSVLRLINDRRALNEHELRLDWARLPHGAQLAQLVVGPDEVVVASGDDLSNFFHCLRHSPVWWPRNSFSRNLFSEDFPDLPLTRGTRYRACFKTVCMGDLNALDVAHQTHECILQGGGAMLPAEVVRYRSSVPPGKFWEFLYIDDHWGVAVVPAVCEGPAPVGGVATPGGGHQVRACQLRAGWPTPGAGQGR
jgi:hypothetical protein